MRKQSYVPYLFIAPSIILIFIWAIIPIFMMLYYSVTDFNILQAPNFVGLDNFKALFDDPNVKPAIRNTLVLTAITVPIQTFLALVLASLVARKTRTIFDGYIRSSLFIPVIASTIVVGAIWRILFASEGGDINAVLGLFNIEPLNWLGTSNLALITVCIVRVWKSVGYFMVIYLAGILEIPSTYYEAAALDGANAFQKLIYITLPSLKPITFFVTTLGTIWGLQTFDLAYTMTGGGPGTSTLTMVYSIYNVGFKFFKMGYASALSVFLFLIILTVSLVQKRFTSSDD